MRLREVGVRSLVWQANSGITVHNTPVPGATPEAVLFPFDTHSVPFSAGLRLQLVPGKIPGRANPIVVPAGPPGSPDDASVRFYGTVIPFGDELRMWYLAKSTLDQDGRHGPQLRVCYATSRDGAHWEKPHLGLVEFNGNTRNNIVNLRGGRCDFVALPIIHEADDPDPKRRFKTVFESHIYGNRFAVAYSPDGLNWTESPNNPVGQTLEQTGLIRHNGLYYVNGQGGGHYATGRVLLTYASADFETWTQASCLGHRRDMIPPRPLLYDPVSSAPKAVWNVSEEVHLGAGLWDRGNVILGIYDIWHGTASGDRSMIGMDLGLLVSHDALHFSEPIPDFPLVPAYEEIGQRAGAPPKISHGQGMVNWGDKTFLWYENWGNPPVEVRLASWPRHRIGYVEAMGGAGGHLITCPFSCDQPVSLSLNVAGLSQYSELNVELLDFGFHPIEGFSGAQAAVVTGEQTEPGDDGDRVPGDAGVAASGAVPGLNVLVSWGKQIPTDQGPLRIRAELTGVRPEDIQLYAIYVEAAGEGGNRKR